MTHEQKRKTLKNLRRFYFNTRYVHIKNESDSLINFLFLELIFWDSELK